MENTPRAVAEFVVVEVLQGTYHMLNLKLIGFLL